MRQIRFMDFMDFSEIVIDAFVFFNCKFYHDF